MGARVLTVFLEDPSKEQYGFALLRLTGVKSGSLYPFLARLEAQGWLEAWDEAIDVERAGRPRRRLYRLTGLGEREGRRAVAGFYRDLAQAPSWLPGFKGA